MVLDAKVLVLDEPTSSLDRDEVERLFAVIRDLRDKGVAILFVSHFLDQVYEISDRITVLRNGRLVGEYLTSDLPRGELVTRMIGRELDELTAIYRRRGLDAALAREVAIQLHRADPLAAHLRDELGIVEAGRARPLQAASVSARPSAMNGRTNNPRRRGIPESDRDPDPRANPSSTCSAWSSRVCPISTAAGYIGSERSRSMMPLLRSSAMPTPVKAELNTIVWAKIPGMTYCT